MARISINGVRVGNYWRVGDVENTPGSSMRVRLGRDGMEPSASRWIDAATGQRHSPELRPGGFRDVR